MNKEKYEECLKIYSKLDLEITENESINVRLILRNGTYKFFDIDEKGIAYVMKKLKYCTGNFAKFTIAQFDKSYPFRTISIIEY